MNQVSEQGGNNPQQMLDELAKALIGGMRGNEVAIRELTDLVRKQSDPTPILKELGKRITTQEKSFEELGGELKGGLSGVEADIKRMSGQISIPTDSILGLRADLQRHAELFEKPHRKEIHYRHFLGKSLLTLIGLLVIIMVLVALLTQAYGRSGEHAENDLKWRYLNLSSDPVLLKVLGVVDQGYHANPEQFKKDVVEEEDRQHQLFEATRQEKEAQMKVQALEGGKKK